MLLVLLGLALGLLIGEAGLRLFGADLLRRRMVAARAASPLPERRSRQYHVTEYGYALDCEGQGGCNPFGKLERDYRPEKAPGVFRILVLGDSITEQVPVAWENPESLVWVQYLEKELSRLGRYEFLNSAKGGFNLPNYLGYLKARGLGTEPDLVLAAFCVNDVDRWSFIEMDGAVHMLFLDPGLPFFPTLFRLSRLFQYAVLSLAGSGSGVRQLSPLEVISMLGEMKDLSGGRIAAVVFPPFTEPEAWTELDRYKYELITTSLEAAGIDYFEARSGFSRQGARIRGYRRDPDDPIHFDRRAQELSARAILPWLRRIIAQFPAGSPAPGR